MLASVSGINSISGPGMLDFESCQSLEKLVLDDEICGMCLRLTAGIEPGRISSPPWNAFKEMLRDDHLLISPHTRTHLKQEHYFPGPVWTAPTPRAGRGGGKVARCGSGPMRRWSGTCATPGPPRWTKTAGGR